MDLVILVLVLAAVGFLLWLITTQIPMDPIFRTIIQIVVAIVVVLWLLGKLGAQMPSFL